VASRGCQSLNIYSDDGEDTCTVGKQSIQLAIFWDEGNIM